MLLLQCVTRIFLTNYMNNPVFVVQSQSSVASIIAILSHYLLLLLQKGMEGIRKFTVICQQVSTHPQTDVASDGSRRDNRMKTSKETECLQRV